MVQTNKRRFVRNIGLGFLTLILSACTALPPVSSTVAAEQSATPLPEAPPNNLQGWWSVKFQMPWQPDTEPNWSIGTWIAADLLGPVIQGHHTELELWRVHRRAARDAGGYTFSFIFYASAQTAAKVYAEINVHPLIAELKQRGLLAAVQQDELNQNNKPAIADTSDSKWPPSIRQTWPYFIMGASQMWLELVKELNKELQNISDPQARYQLLQSRLTDLWRKNGQHAWLHHLSALYGYSPLEIEF